MGKSWEIHGKIMGKSWENHGNIMGNSWENHGKYEHIWDIFKGTFYCEKIGTYGTM